MPLKAVQQKGKRQNVGTLTLFLGSGSLYCDVRVYIGLPMSRRFIGISACYMHGYTDGHTMCTATHGTRPKILTYDIHTNRQTHQHAHTYVRTPPNSTPIHPTYTHPSPTHTPFSPGSPGSPCCPLCPLIPADPLGPGGPWNPCEPGGPARPWPTAPGGPASPGKPLDPGGPSAPTLANITCMNRPVDTLAQMCITYVHTHADTHTHMYAHPSHPHSHTLPHYVVVHPRCTFLSLLSWRATIPLTTCEKLTGMGSVIPLRALCIWELDKCRYK